MSENSMLNIGISMGDPNGVGPEVIIKTLCNPEILTYFNAIVYGNPKVFIYYSKLMEDRNFKFNQITEASQAKKGQVNLIATGDKDFRVEAGKADLKAGEEAYDALNKMLEDASMGKIQAIVTSPLDKSTVKIEGIKFTGHTGFMADYFKVGSHMMLLTSDELKVGLVTEHLALSEVVAAITPEIIYTKIQVLHQTLKKDYSIIKPKIAVLGLNPHNGDNGLMGKEELEIIKPAVKKAYDEGQLVFGPYAADGFFGNRIFRQFDAVLAMYHDQGLIPFKYIAFEDGINFTAGLPFIRTSPDHGTAYDIAGKNKASITSFLNALLEAVKLTYTRNENEGMIVNYLPFTEMTKERFKMNFSL